MNRGASFRPLIETVAACEAAKRKGDSRTILDCLRPDAIVETIGTIGRPGTPEAAVAANEALLRDDPYYLEGRWEYEQVAPEAVLTTTSLRERSEAGGIRHRNVVRLTTGRDGLIWRQRLFASRQDALACWAEHGVELGL